MSDHDRIIAYIHRTIASIVSLKFMNACVCKCFSVG